MSDARWQRMEALFHELSDLGEAQRSERLSQIAEREPELARQLSSLIRAAGGASGIDEFIGGFAAEFAADVADSVIEIPTGTTLGPYRIASEIARGGMGVVYLAERIDGQFDQRVAIKILSSALGTPDAAVRFRSERQILARLDHPNVARLLDGGTTDEGLPYLVMEYIDGVAISEYCQARGLGIRQRLDLFRLLCSAVQAAHQRLIVHRDIKPSNVLVTSDGTPKLLDFGIAKLLEPDAATHTVAQTMAHVKLLTPEYASPEQLRGEPVTTASDVYALGVLLYELLTGHAPYEFTSRLSGEIERVVCTTTPARPSSVTSITGGKSARRELTGDLDNIVLMAMRKEPERRYSSAAQLGDDIQRYLRNQPISARRDAWRYVVGKFVSRHRAAVVASTVALAVTVGLAAFFTWQLAEERDIAQRERDTAERVSAFMVDIFRAADPYGVRRGDVTTREVLAAAVERIDRELTEEPLIRAALLQAMGDAYRGLGAWREAAALLERSVEQARRVPGTGDLQLADSLAALGSTQQRLGLDAGAEVAFRESVAILDKRLGPTHPDTLDVFNAIGGTLRRQGRFEEALGYHGEAERLTAGLEQDPDGEYGNALMSTGMTHYAMKNYPRAEDYLRRALEVSRKQLHENHEQIYTSLAMLGLALHGQGRNDEAEAIYEEVIERQLAALGPEHPMMGRAYRNLAQILAARGDDGRAEQLLVTALEVFTAALGPESSDVAEVRLRLGRLYAAGGRAELAGDQFRRAIEIGSSEAVDDSALVERAREALDALF